MRYAFIFLTTLVVMAVFTLGGFWLIRDIQDKAKEQTKICHVARNNNMTLRRLLLLAQRNARISLHGHPEQLVVSVRFYKQAFAILTPVDCSKL
jgi:hypothetical protein